MANAEIIPIGMDELELLTHLYNQVFTPGRDVESFKRRFSGRLNPHILLAQVERDPVGFVTGFELKPDTYFGWLCGVLPSYRREGIASQLFEAQAAWARNHGYELLRFECHNRHRPMLHTAIARGFDIIGLRWDRHHHDNLIIFEKDLSEE